MNKLMTLGMLLGVAVVFTGCKGEEKTPVAEKTVTPQAPADRAHLENLVTLNELQKGEVIRGGAVETAPVTESKPLNYAAPKTENTPLLSYSDIMDCQSGSCRVSDLQEANSRSESLKGMLKKIPILNHATAKADTETFEEQSLLAGEAGNYNDIRIPESALRSTGEYVDVPETPEVKLPGSGHSHLPAPQKAQRDLWPGGIPLEAEIDPEVTGF